MTNSTLSRRTFLKGAFVACALVPFGGALAACSTNAEQTPSDNAEPEEPAVSTPESTSAANEDAAAAGNASILVAYYSAQGHTEAVAQTIADELGADLFAITPVDPYTDDDLNWNDEQSRVSVEHLDPEGRHVELETITPENFDSYDTVLLGYPIWWGDAAWPVDDFVSGNDFSGKTVIPFCTSSSSPLDDSGQLLAEMAGTGDWQEGMRFSQNADAGEISEWTASLSL